MTLCPSCQQPIEVSAKHAGSLFRCPHCHSQFFIDFSGNPEPAQKHEAEAEVETPAETPYVESTVDHSIAQENVSEEAHVSMDSWTPPADSESGTETRDPRPEQNLFADVVDYGNSEQNSGPITYTVTIQGLELAETFELLREAVTDSKFGWEAEEVMARVNKGELVLSGLTPTKASILINRIKYLPIGLSWKQEVYGESS